MKNEFYLKSPYSPSGDQGQAIEKLEEGLDNKLRNQVLLGVTGSGKTFTVANVIARTGKPTLVLAPNKTLAAQLFAEFRELFPKNAVEYFVSYYDYYQPEAYIPRTDTYIEKDSSKNEEIDRLRNSATRSLLTRRDVIVVASVSCIYGIGSPEYYLGESLRILKGEKWRREVVLRKLSDLQYTRGDMEFIRARFRVRGENVDIWPAGDEVAVRVEFFGDNVEGLKKLNPLTGEIIETIEEINIFPASHYVTPKEMMDKAILAIHDELVEQEGIFLKEEKLLEAQRIRQRTEFDLEMMRETGTCAGIENYSRFLTGRVAGERPYCLFDYLPDDALLVIDESHVAVPQIGGMFGGDRSRKEPLVKYGFRLPSAFDNRPLMFNEWDKIRGETIYMSATPGPFELGKADQVVEQIVRPTGLIDPKITVRPATGQVDDLLKEIREVTARKERVLITTLTKRMAEELADYLMEANIKAKYLHSDIETLERIEILRDLRLGVFDVLVGINLLREGLDLPEVSLVAIMDADKEGFLRGERALIQTIGRAARNILGKVIMYADKNSEAMNRAIFETERRRKIQTQWNMDHGVTPQSIVKAVYQLETSREEVITEAEKSEFSRTMSTEEGIKLIKQLEREMKKAAKELDFEKAARLRDRLVELRREAGQF